MRAEQLAFLLVIFLAVSMAAVWRLRLDTDAPPPAATLLVAEADCDSSQRICVARSDSLTLGLRMVPPVRALQPFALQLGIPGEPLPADARVEVQLQMRGMDMGVNRYRLVVDAEGIWHGTAIVPVCVSGRSDWLAQVEVTAGGKRWLAELPFTLSP